MLRNHQQLEEEVTRSSGQSEPIEVIDFCRVTSVPFEERFPMAAAEFPWTSTDGELVSGIKTSQIPSSRSVGFRSSEKGEEVRGQLGSAKSQPNICPSRTKAD